MNTRTLRTKLLLPLAMVLTTALHANNIQVTNTTLVDNTGSTAKVQFDISWENSWRGGGVNNWDAAWVFVKYRSTGGIWQHARLANSGHVAPSGSVIEPGLLDPLPDHNDLTNPVLGVFIHRAVDGTGNFSAVGTQLQWNYGVYGINAIDIGEVKVFAMEMVYVPQGAFAAGSGGGEAFAFTLTTISTAVATGTPNGTGLLGGQNGGYPTGATAPNNALWPNGYDAFYCMKYEVSQQGYVDFLNTLTYVQQATRTTTAPSAGTGTGALDNGNLARNGIDVLTPGVDNTLPATYVCNLTSDGQYGQANDGKDVACSFLSWGDLTAYLDWSGLRPMTELEFEKACRGTTFPLPNGFPWGTTSIHAPSAPGYLLTNPGSTNEGIGTNYGTVLGNAVYDGTSASLFGPVRVGAFAANPLSTGRISAGATYYGIMEMAGNLYERVVTIGNTLGRLYVGNHGNGSLAASGHHDAPTWPSSTTADGSGLRGGAWNVPASNLRISDRLDASAIVNSRSNMFGGRGVRTAP
ncbi:MAG: SUMF1/EgtB/PvdO family nonheme iron enzyme [Flavobacteriales bacterium]